MQDQASLVRTNMIASDMTQWVYYLYTLILVMKSYHR